MGSEIELEWDEDKRQQTLQERGLDFMLARYILTDPNLVRIVDNRRNYKETRYIAYGMVQNDVFCICYTIRDNVHRIISLRRTHKKERMKYYGKNS
ncbi:MAG: BrnT family toxin [Treponema sp.]|nr:BrnT family toxin [Treponema sp.]